MLVITNVSQDPAASILKVEINHLQDCVIIAQEPTI
jgi:hypothetical protein